MELTPALIKAFEEQGNTEGMPYDKIKIVCKAFYPMGSATWYLIEYLPEDEVFFAFCSLFNDHNDELGYVALSELRDYKDKFGIGIEIDEHFGTHYLSELINGDQP